jgi:hypothetical protein
VIAHNSAFAKRFQIGNKLPEKPNFDTFQPTVLAGGPKTSLFK